MLKMAFIAALATATLSISAHAAPLCGKRDDVVAQLSKKYKEAPAAVGLANGGALVEVLTSEDGATWTIVVSSPDGTTCLVAAGQEWQALKRAASHEFGT
jgi:hypothetical protein